MNYLHYGDNLGVLRNHIESESVDLIYLDPPFNSNRNYNVLFREKSGSDSPAQIKAFGDTWRWDEAAVESYHRIVEDAPDRVSRLIEALRVTLGDNDMLAYLVMMTERLVELHRVLKPTGSIYLHCDPTASHYLKMLMDAVFGSRNYRNEIIWKRTSSHGDSKKWGHVHDTILYYSASSRFTWNPPYLPHDEKYVNDFYRYQDDEGRYRLHEIIRTASMGPRPNLSYEFKGYVPEWGWRVKIDKLEEMDRAGRIVWAATGRPYRKMYLREREGTLASSIWSDIQPLSGQAKERLGYPTQKPLALLERIIQASSNPGDVVLDPFCGCGTAVAAAQKLGRNWIGIDITHLAVSLMQNRLFDMFGDAADYQVVGTPVDMGSARRLAESDRYEFQAWANSLVHAHPLDGRERKGPDKGIDGIIRFIDDDQEKVKRVLVQVKSNQSVGRPMMEQLRGTIEREREPMGLLLSLNKVTKQAEQEAASAGFYESAWWGERYPRLQAFSVEEYFDGYRPRIPPSQATFQRSLRHRSTSGERQSTMFD